MNGNENNNSNTERQKTKAPEFTEREIQILRLLAQCKTDIDIAEQLDITEDVLKSHEDSILKKFNVQDKVLATIKALKRGII